MPEDKRPSRLPDIPVDRYRPTGQLPPEERGKKSPYRPLLIGLVVIFCITIVLVFFQPFSWKDLGQGIRHLPGRIAALFTSPEQESPLSPSDQPQVEVSDIDAKDYAEEPKEETPVLPEMTDEERYRLQIEELQEELVGLRDEREKLQQELKNKERELNRVSRELKEEQEKRDEAEKKTARIEAEFQTVTSSYEAKMEALEEQARKDKETYEEKITELRNRLDEVEKEMAENIRLYDSRSQKEADAVADILRQAQENRRRREKAEADLSAAQREIVRLKEQLAEAQRVREGDLVPLDEEVIKPEIIESTSPRYPLQARRRGIQGVVRINALISETGDVLRATVVNPSPDMESLEEAALEAVKQWKFAPAIKDGQRVKVWMVIPVRFKS
ncbi:MAG: TonB family protein [Acidobacteriota bacterium]